MDKEKKSKNNSSRILPGPAVPGLPSMETDTVPTNVTGKPMRNNKDTSELESLFDKLE